MTIKVAICRNDAVFYHGSETTDAWEKYCTDNNIPYDIVDCYSTDIIEKLSNYDAILWKIQNYVVADIMESRSILEVARRKGLKVFPNYNTSWHFDDKISESYLLQAIGAPTPKTWVFYLLCHCLEWISSEAKFPIVAKLRCGSGANNVKMLKDKEHATKYAKRMFSKGFNPSPSFLFKAKSKAQSSRDWKTVINRVKKIPLFIHTLSRAKMMQKEKGYVYFQEFIPTEGYDIKVVVVGDKLSFFCRRVRKGDFRASGGGDIFYDKNLVTKQIMSSAFDAYENMGLQCVGFDYVVDKNNGMGYIIEMCYGFDFDLVKDAGGYWNKTGKWYDEPLDVAYEIINNLIHEV